MEFCTVRWRQRAIPACGGSLYPWVNTVTLFMTVLLNEDFRKFLEFRTLRKTEVFVLMHCFPFLFIPIWTVARLVWLLTVLELFFVIAESPGCLLPLAVTARPLSLLLRLLTFFCANTSIVLGNQFLLKNKFCAKLRHSNINLSMFFFFLGLGALSYYFLYVTFTTTTSLVV